MTLEGTDGVIEYEACILGIDLRTSTGATPFSLVYGIEAVLPVEVQIPSLRVLMDVEVARG